MTLAQHQPVAPERLRVYVVTLSDTREDHTDTSGASIREGLQEAGHEVAGSCILREEAHSLRADLDRLLERRGFEVLIVNGGTGIAPRDVAYDILSALYDREIPGFGELFRSLSYAEIGSAAMLSRASAGVAHGKLLFSIPGSQGAVRLAMHKLILPELRHMVGELRRAAGAEHAP
ncbi:MAG: molybdenum cofactor biosynthesis protein B [Candidatus Krumholzibacteriia bacterium]